MVTKKKPLRTPAKEDAEALRKLLQKMVSANGADKIEIEGNAHGWMSVDYTYYAKGDEE